MNSVASDARNTQAPAMSSGSPMWPGGVGFVTSFRNTLLLRMAELNLVLMTPGAAD